MAFGGCDYVWKHSNQICGICGMWYPLWFEYSKKIKQCQYSHYVFPWPRYMDCQFLFLRWYNFLKLTLSHSSNFKKSYCLSQVIFIARQIFFRWWYCSNYSVNPSQTIYFTPPEVTKSENTSLFRHYAVYYTCHCSTHFFYKSE